jgi:hypothetical protein
MRIANYISIVIQASDLKLISTRILEFFLSNEELKNVTLAKIKKSYHKKALKFHPDKSDHENANYIFEKIKAAYEMIDEEAKINSYIKYLQTDQAKIIYEAQKNLDNYFLDSFFIENDVKSLKYKKNNFPDLIKNMIIEKIDQQNKMIVSSSGAKHLNYLIKLKKEIITSANLSEMIHFLNCITGVLSFKAEKVFNFDDHSEKIINLKIIKSSKNEKSIQYCPLKINYLIDNLDGKIEKAQNDEQNSFIIQDLQEIINQIYQQYFG